MGTCSTVSLNNTDTVQYLTVYYSSGPGPLVGIKITGKLGQILRLGNTLNSSSSYTFTFENNSLLVGFYGTMLSWQINSLGMIYLDTSCIPSTYPDSDASSSLSS